MLEFRQKYGFAIGIVFLVSSSVFIVLIISKIYKYFINKILEKKLPKIQIKYLKQLNVYQVEVVKKFISEPTNTLILPVNDGLVIGLQHFNVITPAGQNHLVDMIDPRIKYIFYSHGSLNELMKIMNLKYNIMIKKINLYKFILYQKRKNTL